MLLLSISCVIEFLRNSLFPLNCPLVHTMSHRAKGKQSARKSDPSSRKRKRESSKDDEDVQAGEEDRETEGESKEERIGPNDFFSLLPPDCLYAVCDHLEREVIDDLSAVNRRVYKTIHSPQHYKLGIRKEECTLHFYKNVGGFGFDFGVKMRRAKTETKKGPRGERSVKKKVERNEVYSYYIDRKGKERRYIDENLEFPGTSKWVQMSIKEVERKSPGTFPIQLYDALRAIPIRFSLKNLWFRFVIMDSTLLNTITEMNPSKISSFGFSLCSLDDSVTREECAKALEWLDGLNSVQGRRSVEAVDALKKLLQEAVSKKEESV